MMNRLSTLVLILLFARTSFAASPITVDALGITVKTTPRQFVSTNKEAGTYYSEVLSKNSGGWFGWFVNAEKIMHDYELTVGGRAADRSACTAVVYPHQTVRQYKSGLRETFTMLDSVNALVIEASASGRSATIDMTLTLPDQFMADSSLMAPARGWKKSAVSGSVAGVPSAIVLVPYRISGGTVFVVSAGESTSGALRQADSVFTRRAQLIAARRERMNGVLARAAITTDDKRFTTAFAWAVLQMDALIMRQAVNGLPTTGIFAGLPWFNNYWGRDSFISLPGATYVTGNFSDAKAILRSYARFQATDTMSTNYGRIPNLATPTSVQYNTADGTPWFVKGVFNYMRTSGDMAFVREMYPIIKRSIEGTLKYHADSLMFLTHADAETWMDAVGPEGPWSPRGTRANDIQALWHDQLTCASEIARMLGDSLHAETWNANAAVVKENFNRLFIDRAHGLIFDHLKRDGTTAPELRPNQLFCLDLLESDSLARDVTEHVLSQLVYEHGTGTLSQLDSNFTPYHHYEPYYVQDAAYHNGIVWTWLNGAAIRAATRFGCEDTIYRVTKNMVHQILERGCVGTLSELLDAHARPSEREPRLSGTYSQAWSLAEFIRSMYEDYLGARVDARTRKITLAPRIPSELKEITFPLTTPDGMVSVHYQNDHGDIAIALQSAARATYRIECNRISPGGRIWTKGAPFVLSKELSPMSTTTFHPQSIDIREVERRMSGKSAHVPPSAHCTLAKPVLMPYLKALKGPSYPLLPLSVVSAKNHSARVLFDADDPAGDDKGPQGAYTYPSSVYLKPGSLDITHARVRYDAKNLYVSLRFRELSNPGWHPEYGFQLTLAAIAIQRSASDTQRAVGVNSNMTLDAAHAYSRMLIVGGGYRVTDEGGNVLCEYRPRAEDVKHPMGSTATKTIEFAVPLQYLGTPNEHWKMTIMTGAQDDHGGAGVGEFRAVSDTGGEWTGGGKTEASEPNVYDTLVLEKK